MPPSGSDLRSHGRLYVLSAARAVALPAASAYPTGTRLIVIDKSGSCSATNTITLNRAGSDTINGATSAVLATAYGHLAIESNGSGKWTIVDQKGGPLAPAAGITATAPVTLTAGTNLTTPAAGAIEYDGAAFYATVAANERGVLAAEQIQILSSPYTLTSTTAAQKCSTPRPTARLRWRPGLTNSRPFSR